MKPTKKPHTVRALVAAATSLPCLPREDLDYHIERAAARHGVRAKDLRHYVDHPAAHLSSGREKAKKDPVERFWEKVDRRGPDECWLWRGGVAHDGRGVIFFRGNQRFAHRVAWEIAHGRPPGQLWVTHECGNPLCVNPDHLRGPEGPEGV